MMVKSREEPRPAPQASPQKLQILVVEDRADCADSLAMLLRLYGHDVDVAADGHAVTSGAAGGDVTSGGGAGGATSTLMKETS
jgi:PleD family two-component response regulator